MTKMTRLMASMLSSLLVLLGFGGCRSTKRAAEAEKASNTEDALLDSLKQDAQQTEDNKRIQQRPDASSEMRLLYGPPPTRFRK